MKHPEEQQTSKGVKVCHITTVHPSRDIRIFHKECVTLADAGYDVTLIVANGDTAVDRGVKVKGVLVPFNNRIQRMLRTPQMAYKAALEVDADIYHFHDPDFILQALKLLRKGKRVVYDVHEDVPRQIMAKFWIPKVLRKLVASLFQWLENYAAGKMTYVITSTPNIRERFLKSNKRTLDVNNFPLLSELLIAQNWEQKSERVCYVGGISRERGNTQMIQALDQLDGVEMVLAGNYSPSRYREELLSTPGNEKVIEKGYVGRQEAVKILSDCKIGLVTLLPMPNHINSQPNKMFEYMAAGLPVIASNFPLWREIIEGHQCGLCVNPEDPDDIAKAMKTMLENSEDSKLMGVNGQKAVEAKYNWEMENGKLLDIYEQIMKD